MKITKSQLMQIIKEEINELEEAQGISDRGLEKAISMTEDIRDQVENEEMPITKPELLKLINQLREFLIRGY